MSEPITITLPLPDRILSPNARCHWAAKAKAVKAARSDAGWLTRQAMGKRPGADSEFVIRRAFYWPDRRRHDEDNAAASTKGHLDGIAEAMGVDDSRFHLLPVEFGVDKANPRLVVEVTPI